MARLAAGEDERQTQHLREQAERDGAVPVRACAKGEPVCVSGALRAVTLRPLAGVPTLQAELDDGTDTLTLIWLGRRRIAGIECGRSLVARGRLTTHDGRPAIYNAAYELRPPGA